MGKSSVDSEENYVEQRRSEERNTSAKLEDPAALRLESFLNDSEDAPWTPLYVSDEGSSERRTRIEKVLEATDRVLGESKEVDVDT